MLVYFYSVNVNKLRYCTVIYIYYKALNNSLSRVLLLRAELLCDTPNYVVALPSLMTSLSKCKANHLLHLEALTTLQVAAIQVFECLSYVGYAIQIID